MVKHIVACSLVLLMFACALNVVAGASIKQGHDIVERHELRVARQATDDDGSSEDSDEDDEGAEEDVALAQSQNSYAAQQAGESGEDSDEDDGGDDDGAEDDDDELRRRRRDAEAAVEKPANEKEESATETDKVPETTIAPTATTVAPTRKSSVLVQIRDALKKVTTGLPTEQVANNALQYFQLFEHFIQQTIEQYIDDDDDEEEEAATIAAAPATTIATPEGLEAAAVEVPSSADTKAPEASVENAVKPDSVGEKPATETVETPAVMQAAQPAEASNNAV